MLACVAEVLAPKAGNVHPGADFDDTVWFDFVTSASVCAPLLDRAPQDGVGPTVLACVDATRKAVESNTNLGMLLLLAPLCSVLPGEPLRRGVQRVLNTLRRDDAQAVYEAIRVAKPGGLDRVAQMDVDGPAPDSLVAAMRCAANLDVVARQYVNGFTDVLDRIMPGLCARCEPLDRAIVRAHLAQMAHEPDSLIVRKCGHAVGGASQCLAAAVLEAGWPDAPRGQKLFTQLDGWCRDDAHRRNPGTSADLVTAGLFAALRAGAIEHPFTWSRPFASRSEVDQTIANRQ